MSTTRLEAFSDGVIAILITIMVLELEIPHGVDLAALGPLVPVLLSYVLSFVYLGIYWTNHHHLLHMTERITGGILWANLHLLFWLSLIPFVTGWVGENHFGAVPMAAYGIVLLASAMAYTLLQQLIIKDQGATSRLREAVGRDWKGKASVILYALGIPGAFLHPWIAGGLYVSVAALWLVPDRRIEARLASRQD
jgi:uncharacterized membrane protein